MLPTYVAAPLIRSGELVRLLPEARPRELSIYAVYTLAQAHVGRAAPALDFLVERFPAEPLWDRDVTGPKARARSRSA